MANKSGKRRMARSRARLANRDTDQRADLADTLAPALHDPDTPIPDALVDRYVEVAQHIVEHPDEAAELAALSDDEIYAMVTGIAHHDTFRFSPDHCLRVARIIQEWAIMNSVVYLYEWPDPIGAMTPEQIVDAIRGDRDAGLIPLPPQD